MATQGLLQQQSPLGAITLPGPLLKDASGYHYSVTLWSVNSLGSILLNVLPAENLQKQEVATLSHVNGQSCN